MTSVAVTSVAMDMLRLRAILDHLLEQLPPLLELGYVDVRPQFRFVDTFDTVTLTYFARSHIKQAQPLIILFEVCL